MKVRQLISLASIMKLPNKGYVAPGMDADFAVFDDRIRIKDVFVKGKRDDSLRI
ncbi:MAG: hypothetical protein J6K29_04115 [Clostridia bacterium]|nr:hypothetical protein [Clostridia bacterium]